MSQYIYHIDRHRTEMLCSSEKDVADMIDQLGRQNVYAQIGDDPANRLLIFAATEGRYVIQFAEQPFYLFDPHSDSERRDRVTYRWENGQIDVISWERSVSKEKAIEIACYFCSHHRLIPGLQWQGLGNPYDDFELGDSETHMDSTLPF